VHPRTPGHGHVRTGPALYDLACARPPDPGRPRLGGAAGRRRDAETSPSARGAPRGRRRRYESAEQPS